MFPPPAPHQDLDTSIRLTDNDAALARLSAVQKGYLEDPYIRQLIPRAHLQPPKPPLINIGTFIRSTAIDRLVDSWLGLPSHEGQMCQIVSLGAGSDTRFWRIATGKSFPKLAKYVEIDFPEITIKKAMSISKNRGLYDIIGKESKLANGGTSLYSPIYNLLSSDLRRPPVENLGPLLAAQTNPLLPPSLPTLLLFECVLAYMPPADSQALIQWFSDYFREGGGALGVIVYEMFGLNDSFGRVMVLNMKSRNISLPGVEPYQTVTSLTHRLHMHDFTMSHALTLRDIRKFYVHPAELERIGQLEMLDEVEELDLVLQHYAITWGFKLSGTHVDGAERSLYADWALKPLARELDEDD